MDRYVVIGNPIAHSLSPEIHARFAAQTGQVLAYDRLLVAPSRFAESTAAFFAEGGRGANVTLPFKLEAFAFAHTRTQRATLAGAANVLTSRDGRIEADNTDGAGLVADIERNAHRAIAGASILILGAGGAVRGVVGPLLERGAARITIANRTLPSALALRDAFLPLGDVAACPLDAIEGSHDLVVNATSAGTRGEAIAWPAGLFHRNVLAYDMAYGVGARAFIETARAAGAEARDGLGMLVEQAAEAFLLWRGMRPETRAVLAELRARLP